MDNRKIWKRTTAEMARASGRPRMRNCLGPLAASLLTACAASEVEVPADVEDVTLGELSQSIVGGDEATPGAWPTVVAISWDSSPIPPWWCGGTVISTTQVLTAAHCVVNDLTPGHYDVIVGRHDLTTAVGQTIAVTGITIHPQYVGDDNDVAILQLATAVPAGTRIQRLVAPGRMGEIRVGDDATALGWGDTSEGGSPSDTLRQVTVDVIGTGDVCEAATNYTAVTNNEICIGDLAGGHDTCQGDSGGPMFVLRDGEWFQLGVTSWGWGCARADQPGVYAFVPNYMNWIHANAPTAPAPSLLPSALITVLNS